MRTRYAATWKLEQTLWKLPVVRPKDQVVGEVMRQIRAGFIAKASVVEVVEKLRIPEVDEDAEQLALGYNKALDIVVSSLLRDHC